MTLIQRLRHTADIIGAQHSLIRAQRTLIQSKNRELKEMRLEHARELQGMVCAWLINLERPEVDLRYDLAELEVKLGHDIARLEEHVL